MSRTVGINPAYLAKFKPFQSEFLISGVGRAFYDEFLTAYGKHLYIFGTTGSGKTNKGYAFIDYLRHLETQVWISSGKLGEIFPLLCMGKVRIVVPSGVDVSIEERVKECNACGGTGYTLDNSGNISGACERCEGTGEFNKWQRIKDHPEVIPVDTPAAMLTAIGRKKKEETNNHWYPATITVFEIRNAFRKKENAIRWVADMFSELADAAREGTLRPILPMTIHVDESQWSMAGTKVSSEAERTRASEIIAENALELRSAWIRLVLYSQAYKNILPTARENMLFTLLCRGANVHTEENSKLAVWCQHNPNRRPASPQYFRTEHGRFVFESNHNGWGDSYPPETPWKFRLYPLEESDRKWVSGLRMVFTGKHDEKTNADEIQEECTPEFGRYSHLAIPPEKQEVLTTSRYEVIQDG